MSTSREGWSDDTGADPARRLTPDGATRARHRSPGANALAMAPSTARRLDNQIGRALQRTFGARTGLRLLVGMGTREMQNAGATLDAVRHALTLRVLDHQAKPGPDGVIPAPDDSAAAALIEVMLSWAAESYGGDAGER